MGVLAEHKKAVDKIIKNDLSVETARNIWLLSSELFRSAQAAEAVAYLAMRELEAGELHSSLDFRKAISKELTELKNALVRVGALLNA